MVFFDCTQAPDTLVDDLGPRLAIPPAVAAAVDPGTVLRHAIWKQPLVREGTLCLSGFHIAPDTTIPRHAPARGYMAWVWEGALHHSSGRRRLRPGEGFFAAPGRPYSFTTGPTGVRLILFGPSGSIEEDFLGPSSTFVDDPSSWQHPVPAGSPVDDTVFFDWTEQQQYLFEHLEQRMADIPDRVRAEVDLQQFFLGWFWGQPLPMDHATAVRPASYYQAPNSRLPRHRHMNECVYFVTEGTLVQGNRVVHPGGGWYGPPGNPYSVGAGPTGMRMLELHCVGELAADDDPLPPDVRTRYLDADPGRWAAPPVETMHPDPVTTRHRYAEVRRISDMGD
jgi:hypothetical protein